MAIGLGTRLGPYEVTALIGEGGMGRVWRAHHGALNRDDALKVLPEAFASDPERVARFRREAQVLASLNHPHIAHVHGFEQAEGSQALVMELVEGPTLADRIGQGAIPVDEALAIARQIAEALEAAHEQGIVHRDLKPANIKVRPDGTVKVLDFGLAKAMEPSGGMSASASMSPTITSPAMMTGVGTLLGTAAYMSPEQARGKAVDKRSDIWAFGCVLYEMLTGRRAFEGDDTADVLAAVLNKEPQFDRVPARMRWLLAKCLEKNPKRRLRDIGDAFLLLDEPPRPTPARASLPWAVAAVATLVAAVALWASWSAAPADQQLVTRVDLDLGADVPYSNVGPTAVLSPDGVRLVFVSQESDGRSRLMTRRLDQSQSAEVPGTQGAYAPFFSPDGQWVGFFAGGQIKKVRLDGGDPIFLGDAPAGRGASWGDDDIIVAALDTRSGLAKLLASGGSVVPVTQVGQDYDEATKRWPQVLPGATAVLFTTSTASAYYEEASCGVASLQDGRSRIVLEHAGMYCRYLPSGHLVFVKRGTLFAVPFDVERMEVHGSPSPLVEQLSYAPAAGWADFDVAGSGTLIYRSGSSSSVTLLQWLDSSGKVEALRPQPAVYTYPRLSPDGRRLAITMANGPTTDIWVYEVQRDIFTRLTQGPAVNSMPAWSPDGRYVVFSSGTAISWIRADGAGNPQQLFKGKTPLTYPSFSPDGTRVVFGEVNAKGGADIYILPISVEAGQLRPGKPELFLHAETNIPGAAFSPDGRWLAYSSTKTGVYEVYVRAYPDRGSEWPVSNSGGLLPVWSPNGRELFYRTDDQRIMVVSYTVKDGEFVSDRPRVWSQVRLANWGTAMNYDLAPDGSRFAVQLPVDSPTIQDQRGHVTLVLNFLDDVRRRAGR